ncbi:response regulator [Streptomyces sp. NBC_01262]|uniref:response regulator n=1 Tax=Streptomyces sp. NBC_01262 TaxID=2903803 RepID=UPI002E361607|nr:response regulator [Streptomyces sp. NBC_01262]
MTRILIVDDEPQMIRALRINLKARTYDVATAPNATTALQAASRNPPDAVLLDLGLPDLPGIDVIHGLRAWTSVPVIVISGQSDPAEKVAALDAGADDYLTKPFAMVELLARLRAVLRRPAAIDEPGIVDVGPWRVDLAACTAVSSSGQSEPLHLTPTEWRLLIPLLRNPRRLITGRQLLREVWGPGAEQKSNYLRIYFCGLRHKLEPDPAHPHHLITEPGLGYRFDP